MLVRILDTTEIGPMDTEIRRELNIDLRRMDHMKHEEMPQGSNAHKVMVLPSTQTWGPGFHRFCFRITYGNLVGNEFMPNSKEVLYQTETLPMI